MQAVLALAPLVAFFVAYSLRGLYVAEDMKQRTDHGAVGFPEKATATKGRAMLQAAIERTVEVVQTLLQRPLAK